MNKQWPILFVLLFIASSPSALAQSRVLPVEWDRAGAIAAVESVDIDPVVAELTNLPDLADAELTISRLDKLEAREDWPMPAREAAMYRFTRSLSALPADSVEPGILDHLKHYTSKTMVAHEDHAASLVPLFNIRGAVAGVEHTWMWREFAYTAQAALADDPATFVAAYPGIGNSLESNIRRRAYADVLSNAPFHDVKAVQDVVLATLEENPGLGSLLSTTVGITASPAAIERLLVSGAGPGVSLSLREAGGRLPIRDLRSLLMFAVEQAPPVNASLAIAAWAVQLRGDPVTRDLMLGTLSNDALGASAALALGKWTDIQSIRALQEIAAGDDAAARRAQMALDFHGKHQVAGGQP